MGPEPAGAVGGDDVVLLVPDTAEIPPLVQLVVVDEVGEVALGAPQVHELRDEVDPGLHRHDEARLQLSGQPQRLQPELCALGIPAVAHVLLAQVLHVVDVHPHHVADATGENHGVGAGGQGFLGVALEDPKVLQAVEDHPGCGEVDVTIGHARAQRGHTFILRRQLKIVDDLLPLAEAGTHREGGGEVAGVAQRRLRSDVQKEEVTFRKGVAVVVVVEGLTVDGGDDGKAGPSAGRSGDALHLGGDLPLHHAGPGHADSRFVHGHRGDHRFVDLGDLFLGLDGPLVHHGPDEVQRRPFLCLRRREAQQGGQLESGVRPVGGQETHLPSR